jgi:predicted kinase
MHVEREGAVIVSPDEIRLALHGKAYDQELEPWVSGVAKVMVRSLFGVGHSIVIVDACHNTRKRIEPWERMAEDNDWSFGIDELRTMADVCIARAVEGGDFDLIDVIERMSREYDG